LRILALNAGEGLIEALPELSMHPGDSFRNFLCSERRCENGRWWLFSQKGQEHGFNAGPQSFRVVPSFKGNQNSAGTRFLRNALYDASKGAESIPGNRHAAEGILNKRVEACRDKDELRSVFEGYGLEYPSVNRDVLCVSESRWKGRVHGKPLPIAAPDFIEPSGAGVVGVLVRGKKEHSGITIEGTLGAISVVQVPVHDENLFQPELFLRICRGYRYIIEQAETHAPLWFRMVARRANKSEY